MGNVTENQLASIKSEIMDFLKQAEDEKNNQYISLLETTIYMLGNRLCDWFDRLLEGSVKSIFSIKKQEKDVHPDYIKIDLAFKFKVTYLVAECDETEFCFIVNKKNEKKTIKEIKKIGSKSQFIEARNKILFNVISSAAYYRLYYKHHEANNTEGEETREDKNE